MYKQRQNYSIVSKKKLHQHQEIKVKTIFLTNLNNLIDHQFKLTMLQMIYDEIKLQNCINLILTDIIQSCFYDTVKTFSGPHTFVYISSLLDLLNGQQILQQ